jgi:hypothetical protein
MQETETNIIIFSRVAALEMEKRNLESFLKRLDTLIKP